VARERQRQVEGPQQERELERLQEPGRHCRRGAPRKPASSMSHHRCSAAPC
jgi:hypothetical protein